MLILLVLSISACNVPKRHSSYNNTSADVPYSEITKLQAIAHSKTIQYGVSDEQFIYYWPAKGDKKNNIVIFVHGGCWLEQFDIKHSLAFTSAIAQQGFDVYSIEYRRTGNGGEWPVALDDILLAIRTIFSSKPELTHVVNSGDIHNGEEILTNNVQNIRITPPVSLIGHSAGGHLASLAAIKIQSGTQSSKFSNLHLFGLAPIIDLISYANGENSCQRATPSFMKGTPLKSPSAYEIASPLSYSFFSHEEFSGSDGSDPEKKNTTKATITATMLIGTNDSIVPQAMAQHPQSKYILSTGAGHFDWIHPGSPAFKQLLEQLNDVSVPSE
jgi:acetyl esterase/lipase